MARREKAREEARFMRGDVGVDGEATEEQKDEQQVEQDKARESLLRNRTWLGRELLTWLLWRSDAGGPLIEYDGAGVEVLFTGRVVLRGLHGEVHELIARGTMAPYSEQVRHALARGLLIHSARVRVTHGERAWEATIDAEFLDIKSAKLPELLSEADDDRVTERLDLTEQLSTMVDLLVDEFMSVRTTAAWRKRVVPALRAWIEGTGERPTQMARAARAR
ncbi:MAG: hypothetical protein WBV82_10275 [Myxococcaceae bacterium]